MKRTHRFRHMRAEAEAAVAAAPSIAAAARSLGVNESTVHRWLNSGKIARPRARLRREPAEPTPAPSSPGSPGAWAAMVRERYELGVADEALVDLGEQCLAIARDGATKPADRLAAVTRFQNVIRQLALEEEDSHGTPETAPAARPWPRPVVR